MFQCKKIEKDNIGVNVADKNSISSIDNSNQQILINII